MQKRFFMLLILSSLLLAANFSRADVCPIGDDFWLSPRSGLSVLDNANIKPCVLSLLNDPKQMLVISYPTNDEAAIYAAELRQWLLALALPSSRVLLKNIPTNTTIQLETQTNP